MVKEDRIYIKIILFVILIIQKKMHRECTQIEQYREKGAGSCSVEIWKVRGSELTHIRL